MKVIIRRLCIGAAMLLILSAPALAFLSAKEYEQIQNRLMINSDGPTGYYVRYENGRETGWILLWWRTQDKTSLAMEATAAYPVNEEQAYTGSFEGTTIPIGDRVEFFDGDGGSLILEFDGDALNASPNFEFDTNNGGFNVTFEGKYVRQRQR